MKLAPILAAAVLSLSAGIAAADIVVRTNHLCLDGKILSQDNKEIVLQPDGPASQPALHLDRSTIDHIIPTDQHGAQLPDPANRQPAQSWNVPPDPVPPPILPPLKTPTYYVIPLHGAVGETYLASALEKSLADAALRKPTVVVLDIDSPGGLVSEAEAILKIIHRYNKELRIVALTDQDLSASAIVTLSVREIYVKPTSTIGAATSFIPNDPNLSAKVEEKMQSAWRAVARNSAEEGNHDPLLAESMIENDRELHIETVHGKPVVKEGPGDQTLLEKGKILCLTSHEAIECGLATGEAEDLADLGKQLKFDHWAECKGYASLLADALPKKQQAFEAQLKKIAIDFKQNIEDAKAADPTAGEITTRIVTMPQPGIPMPTIRGPHGIPRHIPHIPQPPQIQQVQVITNDVRYKWKQNSLVCVIALQKMEQNLKDAIDLATAFGQTGSTAGIQDALATISDIRAKIFDDRNKYDSPLSDQLAAANTPEQVAAAREAAHKMREAAAAARRAHHPLPAMAPNPDSPPAPAVPDAPPAQPPAEIAAIFKKIAQSWQPTNSTPVEILPTLGRLPAAAADGIVTLTRGLYASPDKFRPPVSFRMILQTNGKDTRISYAAQQIIFNWEMDPNQLRIDGGPANGRHQKTGGALPANQWIGLELVVTPDELTIYVDGEKRYSAKADFSKIDDRFMLMPHGSQIKIKSITVVKN